MLRTAVSTLAVSVLALQTYPPAFPRPNATKLLENDRIVVWDIVWPKGQPTPMHRHLHDQVGTYYQRGGRRITNLDGSPREAMTEVGALSNTRAGTTHIEEGTSDPPLRAVFIELKQDSGAATKVAAGEAEPPPLFPADRATRVLDDNRVTVWDCASTRSDAPMRTVLARETVIVWLGDGALTTANGNAGFVVVPVSPGKMEYFARGAQVARQVSSGDPRAMVFEFK